MVVSSSVLVTAVGVLELLVLLYHCTTVVLRTKPSSHACYLTKASTRELHFRKVEPSAHVRLDPQERRLAALGMETVEMPLIEFSDTEGFELLPETMKSKKWDWIIITSPEAAKTFLRGESVAFPTLQSPATLHRNGKTCMRLIKASMLLWIIAVWRALTWATPLRCCVGGWHLNPAAVTQQAGRRQESLRCAWR